MLGAIAGDKIGSGIEKDEMEALKNKRYKQYVETCGREKRLLPDYKLFQESSKFTDDTVMTIATADAILSNKNFGEKYKEYGRKYIDAGYGKIFKEWVLSDNLTPNDSFGNGTAMRVSPVAYANNTIEDVLSMAKISAIATHSHIEAIKGAQAVACAVFLARKNYKKEYIKEFIIRKFGYNLEQTIDEIRPTYKFDATCQGSVPQAIIAFLESNDFEDAIRKAISIGGDSDTIASITGGIAEAYYKNIPEWIKEKTLSYLDDDLKRVLFLFKETYGI